ncbi:MAG TPA: asparagine synthase (glutamine-hydrolyzing) [bacterium]
MCGIAGVLNGVSREPVRREQLQHMIGVLRHRGPDGFGFFQGEGVGLAHARLSIIDLEGGWQPIHNEDKRVWIVFNGEIFNYLELREALVKLGHVFYTRSDTEVIVHLYEEYGIDCVQHLNGQFAFAVWDKGRERLFLARDRVGIRPLFYTRVGGSLLFASEVKSLFTDPRVSRTIEPRALDQVFTFWMTVPPQTAFAGVQELPAGHVMVVEKDVETTACYWDPDFRQEQPPRREAEYAEELRALLLDATRLQLRADVPVGAYLSGGLDSSVIATLVRRFSDTPVRTFSVNFSDEAFDERGYQQEVVDHLGTDHSSITCTGRDIGAAFPDVIWHAEKPILRTAPTPLMLLSRLVRESGYKVVLTGEGSDEILAGYDIFKEAKIRRFLARAPESTFRPLILKRLYPYLEKSPVRSVRYGEAFFNADVSGYPEAFYAHVPRWNTTRKTKVFFSDPLKSALHGYDNLQALAPLLHERLPQYDYLSQAQYLEIKTLLSGYLLCSQGDRMAMANSVEGRFPFLDHRVMEFCFALPPGLRMRALTEKYLLKKSVRDLLPQSITRRTKQPYMAPDAQSFFHAQPLDYVDDLLSENRLRRAGYFNPTAVAMLAKKCRQSQVLGFKDNMALVGILSTMLLHDQFVENFAPRISRMQGNLREETRYAVEV